jgi:hypothetical protein
VNGRGQSLRVDGVRHTSFVIAGIDAQYRVQVHDAPALELGDLGEREPHRLVHFLHVHLAESREFAPHVDGGAPPQLGTGRVPQD